MFTEIKLYLYAAIGIIIIALGTYCYILRTENSALNSENSKLTLVAQQKQEAAKECSDSVTALEEADKTKTASAKLALDEAKKEADLWKTKAANTLAKKPVQPVITSQNINQYGGNDQMVILKDYYATQKLMNDDIDERDVK